MRVSVIVPLYNKAKYVVRALNSIAAQTFGEYEVIVVDDGSTDGGGDLADGFQDERVRVLRQTNAGPGAARNRGATAAQGDLIAFLDADDVWRPEYLESSVRLLDGAARGAASVTSVYIDYPQGVSREPMWKKRGLTGGLQRVTPSTAPITLVHMLAYMWPGSTVARAEIVRRYGGFYDKDGCRYAEDAFLWLKVLLNETVYFQMAPLTEFHREASALSSNYKRARPVEPFLIEPDEVASVCPAELLPLLSRFYAIRACKTAGALGYWGDWREARALFRRFVTMRDWRLPLFTTGVAGCTPILGAVGSLLRAVRGR